LLIAILTKLYFDKLPDKYQKLVHVMNILFMAVAASYGTATSLANPGTQSIWDLLARFVAFTILWGVFFHMVARYWGAAITGMIGEWWVKGIDYVYLTFSFAGLLRVVLQNIEENTPGDKGLKTVTIAAVLVIAIGVALRLTKTSIEIFKWDRP